MKEVDLRRLFEELAAGKLCVDEALGQVASQRGHEDLGFARLDTDRERRTGIAEAIYSPGKTDDQLARLVERSLAHHGKVLATRLEVDRAERLRAGHPQLNYSASARILHWRGDEAPSLPRVAVVTAGTSDLPVAEEAAVVLEHLGHNVDRVCDVGVAGIHRLFSALDRLEQARVLVVAAGFEGALPSVVAGLVSRPVIALPTSVGYGSGLAGIAALLAMLNSCAAGIGVVNIDNGFGAATLAHRIAGLDHQRDA